MKSIDLTTPNLSEATASIYNTQSTKFKQSSALQKVAGVISFGCSISAVVMMAIWMDNSQTDKAYLGGLNWDDLVFNWHPLLMISGMVFSFMTSLLTYRLIPLPKIVTKTLHGLFHTATVVCVSVGLTAVITGNNYTNKNTEGAYYANFFSLHSMLGLTAIIIYGLNYLIGLVCFAMPMTSESTRKYIMPHHVFLGTFALFAAVFAVETGIMELTTELGCSYTVTSADWNPAENYHKLKDGCRLANGIGVMVLITVFFGSFALFGPNDHSREVQNKLDREVTAATTNALLNSPY